MDSRSRNLKGRRLIWCQLHERRNEGTNERTNHPTVVGVEHLLPSPILENEGARCLTSDQVKVDNDGKGLGERGIPPFVDRSLIL